MLRRLIPPASLLGLLVGCGDAPTGTDGGDPNGPVDVRGLWDFVEVLVDANRVATCHDTGSMRFAQTGAILGGSGEIVGGCQGLQTRFSQAERFEFAAGLVSETDLRFVLPNGCTYVGTVVEGTPRRIRGQTACPVLFNGSWDATEARPVSSLMVVPDSISLVVGEQFELTAELRDAFGRRLFGRTLEWRSSDAAVVRVVTGGGVEGLAPGTVTVTVSVEGHAAEARLDAEFVRFTDVSPGAFHSCALAEGGTVYCWGAADRGQSGPAPNLKTCSGFACFLAPAAVDRAQQFASVSAGFQDTCATSATGASYCWGANASGQLGDGTRNTSVRPVAVAGGLTFQGAGVGWDHACGLAADDRVYCWGDNFFAQVGVESASSSEFPVAVVGDRDFGTVDVGSFHACGIALDSATYCWGANTDGRLGAAEPVQSAEPVRVGGAVAFEQVAAGGVHSCGRTPDGAVSCWGNNVFFQLGTTEVVVSALPLVVPGGLEFATITAGGFHNCGLTSEGVAHCWGGNGDGQLGDGSTRHRAEPVEVLGQLRFKQLKAGSFHTCGLTVSDVVYCWGRNQLGELGTGTTEGALMPARVLGQP